MRSVGIALAVTLASGGCGRDEAPARSAVSRDSIKTAVGALVCADSIRESRALACSGGLAHRAGDTLVIATTNGGPKPFVTLTIGDAPPDYQYVGRIGNGALHVIRVSGGESHPTWLLVSAASGHPTTVPEWPVMSPNAERFATGGAAWDDCRESNGVTLAISRMIAGEPVSEWKLTTQDCQTKTIGSGATDLHWLSPDTLAFIHNSMGVTKDSSASGPREYGRVQRPMLAVRDQSSWRIVDLRPPKED